MRPRLLTPLMYTVFIIRIRIFTVPIHVYENICLGTISILILTFAFTPVYTAFRCKTETVDHSGIHCIQVGDLGWYFLWYSLHSSVRRRLVIPPLYTVFKCEIG